MQTIKKEFLKYVSLNIISMIGLSCYVLADTVFIANGMGDLGLTALNITLPAFSIVIGTGAMIGTGGAIKYALLKGNGEEKRGNEIFTQTLAIAIIIGVIFTLAGMFFAEPIARALGADEVALPLTAEYIRTFTMFSVAFLTNNVMNNFIRNDDAPRLVMLAMIAGFMSNIVFDYILIFPCGLGMFGAAFATGFSPVVSLLIISKHFITKKNSFKPIKTKPRGKDILNVLSLGLPSFINEMASGFSVFIFNITIFGITGNLGIAAYGVVANLAIIFIAVFNGVATGAQPLLSRSYGAGKNVEVKKLFRYMRITAFGFAALFYVVCFFFADPVIALFNSEGNAALAEMAKTGLQLYFTAFFLMSINICSVSYFASINRARNAFIISLLRGVAAIVPFILILPQFLGMTGVWITIPCAEAVTLIVALVLIKLSGRKQLCDKEILSSEE